jgi:hypothetical protein
LRRLDRREWAWLSVPALTLLFFAILLRLGIASRGSDVIVKQISIVRGAGDSEVGQVDSYFGVFSPARRTYTVQFDGPALPAGFVGAGAGGAGAGTGQSALPNPSAGLVQNAGEKLAIRQGPSATFEGLSVDAWQMRPFLAESTSRDFGAIRTEVRADGDRLTGTITNASPRRLEAATVYAGLSFLRVGDIAPGERKPFELVLGAGVQESGGRIVDALLGPLDPNATEAEKDAHDERAVVLAAVLGENRPTAPAWWATTPYLIGWQEGAPLHVSVPDHVASVQAAALRILALPVQFGERELSVPPGLLGRAVVDREARYYSQQTEGFNLADGGVVLRYYLPTGARGVQVQQLSLRLEASRRTPGGSPRPFVPELSLFNFKRGEWVDLDDARLGVNPITAPEDYISPGGVIQVWVAAPPDDASDPTVTAVQVTQLDFALSGRRPLS